jgi:hypothetical protein
MLLLLIGCEAFDNRLNIFNNTDKKIRYYYEVKENNDTFPNLKNCNDYCFNSVLPNGSGKLQISEPWENYLKEKPNQVLIVYIINEDTFLKYRTTELINGQIVKFKHDSLHNYSMCEVFKKHLFIKQYYFTYDSLVKLNWKIIYNDKQ